MAKPRFQFSLKALLIATLLASAVLGIAVSGYIAHRNHELLRFGRAIFREKLELCRNFGEYRPESTLAFRSAAFPFFTSDGNEWDYVIYQNAARETQSDEKLVNLHLHLTPSFDRLACEITIKDGSESRTFANDLCAQFENSRITVSVKGP